MKEYCNLISIYHHGSAIDKQMVTTGTTNNRKIIDLYHLNTIMNIEDNYENGNERVKHLFVGKK